MPAAWPQYHAASGVRARTEQVMAFGPLEITAWVECPGSAAPQAAGARAASPYAITTRQRGVSSRERSGRASCLAVVWNLLLGKMLAKLVASRRERQAHEERKHANQDLLAHRSLLPGGRGQARAKVALPDVHEVMTTSGFSVDLRGLAPG